MSIIEISGDGFVYDICADVTRWFLNKYYPRHKLHVEIKHHQLDDYRDFGYCDVVGKRYRPRHFLIELKPFMSEKKYIKILFHELTHMAQFIDGYLKQKDGKLLYFNSPASDYDYEHQPHEIVAREQEENLYALYQLEKRTPTAPNQRRVVL